jgi:hypothetical protein
MTTTDVPDGAQQDGPLAAADVAGLDRPKADGTQQLPPLLERALGDIVMEMNLLMAFWDEARSRGWKLEVDSDRRTWFVTSPGETAGAGYEPPGEVCTGCVRAYDNATGKTLTLTGVETNSEAVARILDFLGWPTEDLGASE